jgi:A/G-specific adenine glycosylase
MRRSRPTWSNPSAALRTRFRRRLLSWYDRNGRDLPWRRTRDPYRILVSEIMLQQTQVDRVQPKYEEWLSRFPTFETLAAASVHEAVRMWYPLGYNIRPRRLHAIAREVVLKYDATLPSDDAALRAFKGIGPYTAGAVRSFAFGRRAPIVDTNVGRVLFRIFSGRGDPGRHATKSRLWELSKTLLPMRRVFDFNQALMDFGATVCVARNPACGSCPMRRFCVSYPFRAAARR